MTVSSITLALAAVSVEAVAGYPDAVYRAIGHPVTWIGRLIDALDRLLNRKDWSFERRRAAGVLALLLLLAITGGLTHVIVRAAGKNVAGWLALAALAATLPAQRSLHQHVRAVADALDAGGLDSGRTAVSMIVGRNPAALDAAGVSRAAIESLAENFSDGVVAPVFWTAAFGLTGGVLYKAANTADSMIGHRTPRHEAFGWAAARFDDLVNLPASRLSALFLVAAAGMTRGATPAAAWTALMRDAGNHRSPNAGWPEAAMAGALGLRLAGPRVYGEVLVDDAYMGGGRREAGPADIRRALAVYRTACVLQGCTLAAVALALLALR